MASSCRDRATSMAAMSSPRRTSIADRDSRSPTPTRRAAHARSASAEVWACSRSARPRSCVAAAAISRMNADAGVEGDDDGDRVPGGSRYDAEDPAADADVEAIQAHLCRRFAAAPSDDQSDDHPMTGSVRTGVSAALCCRRNLRHHPQAGGELFQLQPRPQPGDRVVAAWSTRDLFHLDLGLSQRVAGLDLVGRMRI